MVILAGWFQVECWGITRSVVARDSMVTRQSLCGWSMDGLRSSVELGFGPIFGKMGGVAVELLPNSLSPHLTVNILEYICVSSCHWLLGGSLIYSQTCSVCWESTLCHT